MAETTAPLIVVGYGEGGIDEMHDFVDDSKVQFGLVRIEINTGTTKRNKLLFVHVNGERCPAVARGRENEHLEDSMNILRGFGENESFHASVEFTKKEDVTVEHTMERIKKILMTDDPGDYDIKWMMKNYEQFILDSARAAAAAHKSSDDKGRKRGCPGHVSESLFNNGRDALKAVAGPLGLWNWVFLKPDPDNLPLVEGGTGSVDEMRECMEKNPKEVLFGLLRMGFGVGRLRRTKYVFVQALGTEVPGFQKGKAGGVRGKMETAFKGFASSAISCSAEFDDPADFTIEAVIERVRKAAIIDDDELDSDKAGKNMFSVEAFREAMKEEVAVIAAEEAKAPPKNRGGFGDKDMGELVRLVRAPGSPENWVLFCRNERVRKSTAAAILRPSVSLAHGGPVGGYNRASVATTGTRGSTGTVVIPDACGTPVRKSTLHTETGRLVNLRASTATQNAMQYVNMGATATAGKARLAGALMKQSPGLMHRWQVRHFEISAGHLKWWMTVEEKQNGNAPKGAQDLTGLKVQPGAGGKFQILAPMNPDGTPGRTYLLDADTGAMTNSDTSFDRQTWIQALEKEVILARSNATASFSSQARVSVVVAPRKSRFSIFG